MKKYITIISIFGLFSCGEYTNETIEINEIKTTVNAGKAIGFDAITGKSTSMYSVITSPSGNLITAFPGLP